LDSILRNAIEEGCPEVNAEDKFTTPSSALNQFLDTHEKPDMQCPLGGDSSLYRNGSRTFAKTELQNIEIQEITLKSDVLMMGPSIFRGNEANVQFAMNEIGFVLNWSHQEAFNLYHEWLSDSFRKRCETI